MTTTASIDRQATSTLSRITQRRNGEKPPCSEDSRIMLLPASALHDLMSQKQEERRRAEVKDDMPRIDNPPGKISQVLVQGNVREHFPGPLRRRSRIHRPQAQQIKPQSQHEAVHRRDDLAAGER